MRIALLVAALASGGCAPSLDAERDAARAEIVELERTLPPRSPLWIAEGPDRFDAVVQDGEAGIPAFLHQHLLRTLDAMSDAELEKRSSGDFDFDAAKDDPALFRGKIWRVHGLIGELHAEAVPPSVLSSGFVHAGVFFDRDVNPVLFHVARKPAVLTIRVDSVETRALFVKWIDYESRPGRRVTAPFFVGRTLRRYL